MSDWKIERSMKDTFTKEGAERLASAVRAYWAVEGKDPFVWVEPIEVPLRKARQTTTELWVVRSDMLRGKPRRQFTRLEAA